MFPSSTDTNRKPEAVITRIMMLHCIPHYSCPFQQLHHWDTQRESPDQ